MKMLLCCVVSIKEMENKEEEEEDRHEIECIKCMVCIFPSYYKPLLNVFILIKFNQRNLYVFTKFIFVFYRDFLIGRNSWALGIFWCVPIFFI